MQIVKTDFFEEQVVEAPMSESEKVLDYIRDNGFSVRRCGPKPIGTGRMDMSIYQAVIYRVVESEIHHAMLNFARTLENAEFMSMDERRTLASRMRRFAA